MLVATGLTACGAETPTPDPLDEAAFVGRYVCEPEETAKQTSRHVLLEIDAELASGRITQAEARRRRARVAESELRVGFELLLHTDGAYSIEKWTESFDEGGRHHMGSFDGSWRVRGAVVELSASDGSVTPLHIVDGGLEMPYPDKRLLLRRQP